MLIDFTFQGEAARWHAVDDVVMGGQSSSQMQISTAGNCLFAGNLSLENGGGFASLRRDSFAPGIGVAKTLILRVLGDGKTYRLRLRTDEGWDTPSYQASFATVANEWIDVKLGTSDFQLKWRGRESPGALSLDFPAVRGIGLLIADGQQGRFCLQLAALTAYDG